MSFYLLNFKAALMNSSLYKLEFKNEFRKMKIEFQKSYKTFGNFKKNNFLFNKL